jgi:hypothetical protein
MYKIDFARSQESRKTPELFQGIRIIKTRQRKLSNILKAQYFDFITQHAARVQTSDIHVVSSAPVEQPRQLNCLAL